VLGKAREVRREVERHRKLVADDLIGRPLGGGNVAGAVEEELDPVGEAALAEGRGGETLLVRTIPVDGSNS
jgi:hypothetical protein